MVQRQRRRSRLRIPTIAIGLDVATLLSLLIFSLFSYKQWQALNDQISIARQQITIAQDQIEISRNDQRAWVAVVKVELAKPLAVHEPPVVLIDVANSGRTPAMQLRIKSAAYISDGMSDNLDPEGTWTESTLSPGPNVYFQMIVPSEEKVESLEAFNGLYVSGTIFYSDIFGREHTNRFCFTYDNHGSAGKFLSCEHGNEAY